MALRVKGVFGLNAQGGKPFESSPHSVTITRDEFIAGMLRAKIAAAAGLEPQSITQEYIDQKLLEAENDRAERTKKILETIPAKTPA
jgi:hypothetical protein